MAKAESPEHRLDSGLRAKYAEQKGALDALAASDLAPGEQEAFKTLALLAEKGIAAVLKRRPKQAEAIELLVDAFLLEGAISAVRVGAQRGGDFLINQLRGRWAEEVALSMPVRGNHLLRLGPSGAAMPGEEDHRRMIATFRQIQLVEGKRPDLFAFKPEVWERLSDAARLRATTWPDRLITAEDDEVLRTGRCGIEVKNSTWHYGQRRKAGGTPLSITVKEEELEVFGNWSRRTGLPVLFVQVLFDEIYAMSFRRMLEAIRRGHLYKAGDYDKTPGAGRKPYHRFRIDGAPHLVGEVAFPSASAAHVRVLEDGNVVPYIEFLPATASRVDSEAFNREIDYAGE